MSFFLITDSLALTLTNSAPSSPAITPISTAAGASERGEYSIAVFPNLSSEALSRDITPLFFNDSHIPKVKVLIAELMKTLQSIPNVQNVLGFEISYVNKVPPIGAPKAALTPAELPADMNVRLSVSFRKQANELIGI